MPLGRMRWRRSLSVNGRVQLLPQRVMGREEREVTRKIVLIDRATECRSGHSSQGRENEVIRRELGSCDRRACGDRSHHD